MDFPRLGWKCSQLAELGRTTAVIRQRRERGVIVFSLSLAMRRERSMIYCTVSSAPSLSTELLYAHRPECRIQKKQSKKRSKRAQNRQKTSSRSVRAATDDIAASCKKAEWNAQMTRDPNKNIKKNTQQYCNERQNEAASKIL